MSSNTFLIVGGGIAGLRAAIGLAPVGRVTILTKSEPAESNTGYAQGGIAAAMGDDDSPALHAADTIRAGDGLCDEAAVRVLVENGPRYVGELIDWGTRFDRAADGRPALGREAAHSVRRVLHAGDATGREIGRVLWERVRGLASVATIDHALVTKLVVEDRGVAGVAYFDAAGVRHEVRADATLLATGGAGRVFRETTNPAVATGDGVALACDAGARVADLEFVQFHPTALDLAGAPRFLISEALRGEGARLVNDAGDPFMTDYHADGDLAPRDVVARSIARERSRRGGQVFLTLVHLDPDYVTRRFPTIAEMCRQVGLDLARDRIPVGPAAHYLMGGVDTDEWGRTSIPRLYAAGEVACTGVHGANRLASNSLLEGLVFGARAAEAMQQPPAAAPLKADRIKAEGLGLRADVRAASVNPEPSVIDVDAVRDLMWRYGGLFRTRDGLRVAVDALQRMRASAAPAAADGWRARNLVTVAELIARAALRRDESRGGHFREDFPKRDDGRWRIHVVDQLMGRFLVALLTFTFAATIAAQPRLTIDYSAIAKRIVQQLALKPGERVISVTHPGVFDDLLPYIRYEVMRAGGIDLGAVAVLREPVPESFDAAVLAKGGRESRAHYKAMFRDVDAAIMMPGANTSHAAYLAMQDWLKDDLIEHRGRRTIHFHWVEGGSAYPIAGQPLPPRPEMDAHYQRALLATDYRALGEVQRRFAAALREGEVHITSPGGTDLRFRVGDRPANLQDGDASAARAAQGKVLVDKEIELPAGVVRVAPVEETVDGIIAFPPSQWDGRPVEGLKLRFSKGQVTDVTAASGKAAVEAEMAKAGSPGRAFREIGVGFNPLLAVPDRAPWIPYYGYGAGVVRLSLGDNTELGGRVAAAPGQPAYVRWNFFTDLTVSIGSTTWIRNGKLQ